MAVIYVIKNEKNGKMYVGATTKSIKERWWYHRKDARLDRCKDRKLYSAMREFGEDAFSVSEIEVVDDSLRFEKEQYWIEKLGTYIDGYNETCGGAGRQITDKRDDDYVAKEYANGRTIREISEELGRDTHTIKTSLLRKNVETKSGQEMTAIRNGKKVDMLDMDGNYITTFQSIASASNYLVSNGMVSGNTRFVWGHIKDACEGRNYRKSVAKHKWRYAEK